LRQKTVVVCVVSALAVAILRGLDAVVRDSLGTTEIVSLAITSVVYFALAMTLAVMRPSMLALTRKDIWSAAGAIQRHAMTFVGRK
jgi:hypothetical protein